MLRLAILGALGYAGYRYYEKNRDQVDGAVRRFSNRMRATTAEPALAGGPLSDEARVVSADDVAVS